MDKNFVYTCVECRLSDTIDKDTAQCKQGKFSDQLIVNKTQTALEVGSYQYVFFPIHKKIPIFVFLFSIFISYNTNTEHIVTYLQFHRIIEYNHSVSARPEFFLGH